MCQLYFNGTCSVWNESIVCARKPHRCDSCDGVIEVGASYLKHFSIFDRETTSEKQCFACKTIANAFQREHRWRVTPGSLSELLTQCLDEESMAWERDEDDDYFSDEDEIAELKRSPSRLNDAALRWKYAIVEMEARSAA